MEWQSFLQWASPFVGAFVLWAVKHWIFDVLQDRDSKVDLRLESLEQSVVAIKTSLDKPNGGSSVRDSLNRIEQSQTDLLKAIAHLKGRFDNHIEESRD